MIFLQTVTISTARERATAAECIHSYAEQKSGNAICELSLYRCVNIVNFVVTDEELGIEPQTLPYKGE